MGCKDIANAVIDTVHIKFYLNYVGCKDGSTETAQNGGTRFTLTMWDVKQHHISPSFYLFDVLP